jgi:hypothetical protein
LGEKNPIDLFFHFFQGRPTSTSRTVIPPAILMVLDGWLGGEDGEAGGQLTWLEGQEKFVKMERGTSNCEGWR